MRSTPDHCAVERGPEQNILLQNMFFIATVLVTKNHWPEPCPEFHFVAER